MKQLEEKDLKTGDIFIAGTNFNFINKEGTKFSIHQNKMSKQGLFYNTSGYFSYENLRHATPEEKHWLEVCIAANRSISYEEAMKTFIPEYVECVKENIYDYGTNIIGRIYKVLGKTSNNVNADYLIEYDGKKYNSVSQDRFKPSTKEAYDAQFKEPEFVLPEKWCVKVTLDNNDFINSVRDRSCTSHVYITSKLIIPDIKNSWLCKANALYEGFTEITLEEFKKYVLEEQLEEPKDKLLKSHSQGKIITEVQCSEGGIYKIGDKISVFDKNSLNKSKSFTIKGFRWNKAKTKLCAITELHTLNGIGLDKIELYIEPKIEPKQVLSLLEQAKLRYPIGTKFRNAYTDRYDHKKIFEITSFDNFHEATVKSHDRIGIYYNNEWLHYDGKWAEIVDDFVLPEIWWVKITEENLEDVSKFLGFKLYESSIGNVVGMCKNYRDGQIEKGWNSRPRTSYGSTFGNEITTEQFRKYVLNEKI